MMKHRVMIKKSGDVIAENVKFATGFFDRAIGLMFSKEMVGFDGLLIRPCMSIHTFFMRYEIDVLFLDKEFNVVKKICNLRPWRVTWPYFRASQVIELKGGTLSLGIEKGDNLEVLCIN